MNCVDYNLNWLPVAVVLFVFVHIFSIIKCRHKKNIAPEQKYSAKNLIWNQIEINAEAKPIIKYRAKKKPWIECDYDDNRMNLFHKLDILTIFRWITHKHTKGREQILIAFIETIHARVCIHFNSQNTHSAFE